MFCMYRLRHLKEDRESSKTVSKHKTQTDGSCQPIVTTVNGHSCAPLRSLVNINEMCMLYKRPYLFSYLLSEPDDCRRASINTTLLTPPSPPPRGALFSSYWMLTMSTPVPVAADPHFGSQPSLMTVHAHRPGRNWQAKLAGICWGSAGPRLWRARLPAAIYYWVQVVFFFFIHTSPPTQELYSTGWVQA